MDPPTVNHGSVTMCVVRGVAVVTNPQKLLAAPLNSTELFCVFQLIVLVSASSKQTDQVSH